VLDVVLEQALTLLTNIANNAYFIVFIAIL